MPVFNLGPLAIRQFSGDNWSHLEVAFRTNGKGGMAARETAVQVGFKSEHLIQTIGKDNPNDKYITPEGNVVFGKISITPGGGVHVISAAEIFAAGIHQKTIQDGLAKAAQLTTPEAVAKTTTKPAISAAPAKAKATAASKSSAKPAPVAA